MTDVSIQNLPGAMFATVGKTNNLNCQKLRQQCGRDVV